MSDITIDWYVPDTMEALLSPSEIAALYPGDRLISYCTLYNITSFRDKKTVRTFCVGGVRLLHWAAPTSGVWTIAAKLQVLQ